MKVERWSDAQQPEIDAVDSVNRETDAGIVTPHYTEQALRLMGYRRSYGASRLYRERFTTAFVQAWQTRYAELTKGQR